MSGLTVNMLLALAACEVTLDRKFSEIAEDYHVDREELQEHCHELRLQRERNAARAARRSRRPLAAHPQRMAAHA